MYCASSTRVSAVYFEAAKRLGALLAKRDITIVYGGGSVGLMGALADSALERNGVVVGVIPRFMVELEWAHPDLAELVVVEKLHERRERMIEGVDAVIALPGGCGTFEELIEAITWKRLGMFTKPVVIVNIGGYYDP
ncbi:MAG: TIGR00730 family Rossman fold protein, partial [candidate division KSB1 bacterium]|nr:TIGR00730 family Rossman fold protein [candidate division KSB1 bacterium]